MSNLDLITKRPGRESFKDGCALHDIYDDHGIKWIAKGQRIDDKQIAVALLKGSLTRRTAETRFEFTARGTNADLRPTYLNIVNLTNGITELDTAKADDIAQHRVFTEPTCRLVKKNTDDIMELFECTQFSPYKLTGLTHFLYHETRFKNKRGQLKLLNNAGIQYMLFKGILADNPDTLVTANLLNPTQEMEGFALAKTKDNSVKLSREDYEKHCQQASKKLLSAINKTSLSNSFLQNLIRYFSPHLYFTTPEARLFQQINVYTQFSLPGNVKEEVSFKLSDIPMINLANYFKQAKMGDGLGLEGSRLAHYVGLIPPGTAVQFSNREKGIIIAPKSQDTLYCAVITGMDGQPMISPSLREIKFKDLKQKYNVIPSYDLPLKYEEHSHEKIWKMHIVHENLKKMG